MKIVYYDEKERPQNSRKKRQGRFNPAFAYYAYYSLTAMHIQAIPVVIITCSGTTPRNSDYWEPMIWGTDRHDRYRFLEIH